MKGIISLAAVITIVLVLLMAGRLYTSSVDYNMGNFYGNGFSQFYSGKDISPIYQLSDLPGGYAKDSTLLIVNPSYKYRSDDAALIEAFLNKGGNLVIIDNFGESDSLLTLLNTSIQIRQESLCDTNCWKNESYSTPIITNISDSVITNNVEELDTKNPTSLIVSGQATILAMSSDKSWLDSNNNVTKDANEQYGSYAIMASESYGQGSLTVISDPDIFINDVIGRGDNNKLATNIFGQNIVYLDLSHETDEPGLMKDINIIKNNSVAKILVFALVLLIAFIGLIAGKRLYSSIADNVEGGVPDNQVLVNSLEQNIAQPEKPGKKENDK